MGEEGQGGYSVSESTKEGAILLENMVSHPQVGTSRIFRKLQPGSQRVLVRAAKAGEQLQKQPMIHPLFNRSCSTIQKSTK